MAAEVASREAYIGEKYKHVREGFGVYTYENRFFKYEGEWQNGKKHGHGKLIMADGSYYEGQFYKGEIIGNGFKYFALNGNTYSGEFYMGEFEGQGVMKYANGSVYEGQWHENKRDGHGVFRSTDTSMYQGYHHDNKRHGEGTQIYSNGDRYDGDWVNDKRQGHGEFRQSDGTLYDGQWRNDRYNGQGSMVHCSGIVYEGLWVNGFPAAMATKISLKALNSPHEVIQGQTFDVDVELLNEEGEVIEENGRELRITAGYKFIADKTTKSSSNETSSAGLFEVIEDVEEKPIPTPFGYTILGYPLTDSYNPDELIMSSETSSVAMSRSKTEVSDVPLRENEQAVFGPESQSGKTSEESQGSKDQDTAKSEGEPGSTTGEEVTNSTDPTSTDLQASQTGPMEGFTLPPPVSTQKSKQGAVSFVNLVLPAAPPMYRPFLQADMDDMRDRGGSRASQGSRQGRRTSRMAHDDRSPGNKSKKFGDEKYSRPEEEKLAPPGEYVIMVEDITNPPFMDIALEPAFLQVKVVLPKKSKRRAAGTVVKPQGPKK